MADDHSESKLDTRDYRETVFLPTTPFPMRAGLPKLEPELLEKWAAGEGLYRAIRAKRQADGSPLYVLHDGPPYANGPIHIGHALNKTLKDFVVRSRFALGYDVDYVPGWDCHGLPIEWKIEEQFRAKGRTKDQVSKAEFRAACRAYADQWIDAQRTEFKRLGILGRWEKPYVTMDFATEAKIVEEFHKFLMSGQLYRGSKPVMWSPVERTALADAEIEYHPHSSPTVWVKFPFAGYRQRAGFRAVNEQYPLVPVSEAEPAEEWPSYEGSSIVIWTTTPWTIPANRAISFNPKVAYGLYEVVSMEPGLEFEPWAKAGDRLIVADKLADEVQKAAKIAVWKRDFTVDPANLVTSHPLAGLDPGYNFPVPLLPGYHVTAEAGTGFVHTAPGHGADDYAVWRAGDEIVREAKADTSIPDTVDPDGAYYPSVPLFGGMKVMETEGKKSGKFGPANTAVMDKLIEAGNLLARGRVEHSYPHSWRSKAPVIFRNTAQWFIRMDQPIASFETPAMRAPQDDERGGPQNGRHGEERSDSDTSRTTQSATLRQTALNAIDATAFYPESGKSRIRGMVESRPDWLISRQRAWGTPLAMFVDKRNGEPLRDEAVNARIVEAITKEGADAWFTGDPSRFLGSERDPKDYEVVTDILDVWFDSGCTHAFTIEHREGGPDASHWPADLYLEGSDQSRGWFQSSLLESCGTRGHAPYKEVVTCGMTLTDQGEKMSKSLGNAVEPQTIIKQSGAEIIRLWVATVDYTADQKIGPAVLQTVTDSYRKLRNTLRYLLGALDGFDEAERVAYADMPPLERFILHRMFVLDAEVRAAYRGYEFNRVLRAVLDFCNADLSALYFDIRKDALYCDRPDSPRRRACRTVMDEVFARMTMWLAPLTPFTMEEAWGVRFPDAGANALRVMPEVPAEWENEAEAARWTTAIEVLNTATVTLETARNDKVIGSALGARLTLYLEPVLEDHLKGFDWAEVCRVSAANIGPQEEISKAERSDTVTIIKGLAHGSKAMVGLFVASDTGRKCERCWRILPEVTAPKFLCVRCDDAVEFWDQRHAH